MASSPLFTRNSKPKNNDTNDIDDPLTAMIHEALDISIADENDGVALDTFRARIHLSDVHTDFKVKMLLDMLSSVRTRHLSRESLEIAWQRIIDEERQDMMELTTSTPPLSARESIGPRPSTTGGISKLSLAKSKRKQAEYDAKLLANRLALLKQEELKAWKKIEQTREKAHQILEHREEVVKKQQDRHLMLHAKEAENRIATKKHKLAAKTSVIKKRQAAISIISKKYQDVECVKHERRRLKIEKERQATEDVERAKEKRVLVRKQEEELRKKRVKERVIAEKQAVERYRKSVEEEEIQLREQRKRVAAMERAELELIQRLQSTQLLQRQAYNELEKALIRTELYTMGKYEPPSWAQGASNKHNLSLEVIKSGVVLETIALDSKSHYVAGRMEPLCDLVLQHPSISRTHAALQFNEEGKLFVIDLKSTYGTHVNKRRLPPNEYTQLRVGDVLVFGESTRIYTLLGPQELMPEEYISHNLEAMRNKLIEKKAKKEKECDGISWGFGEDAEEDSNSENEMDEDIKPKSKKQKDISGDSGPYVSSVSKDTITEKDKALYTRLQARMQKLENLRTECQRIRSKQNLGLTDGQQAALDKNEARMQQLQEEIEKLEATLHSKHNQRTSQKAKEEEKLKGSKKKTETYDSDDDDFYDRTKAHANKKHIPLSMAPKVYTVESIRANLRELQHQYDTIHAQYLKNEAQTIAPTEEVDSLEAYLQESNRSLQADQHKKLEAEKARLQSLIDEQNKLLKMATPALDKAIPKEPVSESDQKWFSTEDQPTTSISKPLEPLQSPKTSSNATQPSSKQSPTALIPDEPIASKQSTTDFKPSPSPFKDSILDTKQISSPSKESILATKPIPSASKERSFDTTVPRPSKKRAIALESADESKPKRNRHKQKKPEKVFDESVLEGGESVWQPPANQTGDGRTALNEKYGY
ncbi:hypothetical protein THRCLA_06673 [Thraustotheca clavata]|uniref:FHA domain-containing protein n=1 Tax=Thraustotheca clavata TaxID=74557 RepID=A0A1V9ZLF0_9STRA|nr:hypothetical protein THRCLA_06673 [Thraustotheca clavata]